MTPFFLFLIVSLGAYRVTRLITLDKITEPLRERVAARAKDPDARLAYWISCPWCAGAYVSAVAVALADRYESVPLPGFFFLAVCSVVGLVGSALDG